MKEYMICLLFLLCVSFNDGHTLARIELNNITDVYEIKEGQSTLTITHPEDDKAILREIVYFHVIEKPYTKQDGVAKTPELNTRSFTNGHGYQYVDGNNDVIDNIERGDNDDDGETPVEEDDDKLDEEEPVQEQDDDTSDQEEYDDGDNNGIGTETTESTIGQDDEENDENQTRKSTTKEDLSGEIKNEVNNKEIRTIDDTEIPKDSLNENNKEPENLDVRFSEPDNTPIDNEPIQVQSESRRKREIDYRNLPDAPELPELKLDILPDYIKAIILADQNDDINNEKDNIEDEIEKQVQELEKAVNHPPSVQMENDKMNARTIGNSLDIDRKGDDGQNEAERTYGMSLAGNSGKVWNNINTHNLYYVSEPETHTNTIPILDITDSTTTASIATDEPSETSYEDIRVNNDFNKPKNTNNYFKDIEDSLDEAKKQLEELIQNGEDESIAPTTVTDTSSDEYNIEDSYIAEQPTSIKDKYSKKREVGNGNSIEDDKKGSRKREVRTYGMSLAEGSGVVWNDVNAHISYHVGEPDTIKSTTSVPEDVTASTTKATTTVAIGVSKESKEVNDLDELKDIEESLDQINQMLEELINSTKEAKPTTDKSITSDDNDNGDSSEKKDDKDSEMKNIEDSFAEVNKLLEELIKNSTSEATTESNRDTKEPSYENKSTKTTTEEASFTESTPLETTTTESTTTKSNTLDETTDISTSTPKPDVKNPDDNDSERNHNNGTKHDNEDSKQKQFVKELMKNKFFWQWLQDSYAAYLEVMMKKLDDLISAEVGKQIKQYFEEHKNVTNCNPENKEPHNNTSEKPVDSNNATDIDTIVTTEKPVEPNSDGNQNSTTQNPVVNKEPKEELNNTIDKTENNNSTEDDLARRQNKDSNDKKETLVKIEAKNVYGNSVGNGKVTNIFIFNISKESDLEKIKPLSNGTNGVFVFGLDDKSDKGEVKEQNKDDKNEQSKDVTAKPETINEHKDDIKLDIDQVTTAKPETVTTATEEPKDNSIDSTTENTVEDKQITSTESSGTTTVTHVDEVSSTTEKVIESTTEAKESPTENNKDKTDSNEASQAEQDKPTESPENDSTTQNNDESTATSKLDDTTKDKNDNTQEPDKESEIAKTTTESNEANEDTSSDKIEITDKAHTKEEKEVTTESTKSNEVTTDKVIDSESKTGKDESKENEIDNNE